MTHTTNFSKRNYADKATSKPQTNSATHRIFVALPLPSHIKQELEHWQLQNQSTLQFRKWTHPEDLHITLQFLGDTTNEQLEQLIVQLGSIQHSPFQLQLSSFGSFGPSSAPRILWASVSGELQSLTQLHRKVLEQTEKVGFIAEERRYQPHITVARYYEGVGRVSNQDREGNCKKKVGLKGNIQLRRRWRIRHLPEL